MFHGSSLVDRSETFRSPIRVRVRVRVTLSIAVRPSGVRMLISIVESPAS